MKLSSRQTSILKTRASFDSRNGVALIASLLLIGNVCAQSSHAGHSHSEKGTVMTAQADTQKSRSYVTANAAGMVVVLDRETGKARPLTNEEAQRLAVGLKDLINQSTEGLVQVRLADGSYSMDLQGRFQSVLLAKKDENGVVSQACVDNLDLAAAFFEIDPKLLGILRNGASRSWSSQLETR